MLSEGQKTSVKASSQSEQCENTIKTKLKMPKGYTRQVNARNEVPIPEGIVNRLISRLPKRQASYGEA